MHNYISRLFAVVVMTAASAVHAQLPPPAVTDGLVAHYPFNGNANDAMETVNDGFVTGAQLAPDRFGSPNSAYMFNGTNSSISFLFVPLVQVDNWTISAWINPASTNQNGMAVSMGYDNRNIGDGFSFGVTGTNDATGGRLTAFLSGVAVVNTEFVFPATNRWYHVVMAREAGTTKLYVNSQVLTATALQAPKFPTAFKIGSQTGVRFFNGLVDEVRIYNRALPAQDVVQLYNFEWQDTDQDGLADYAETNIYHTDPLKIDTDGDSLNDKMEVHVYHTDPLKVDTDGDGFNDDAEIYVSHDPLNANDFPAALIHAFPAIEMEFLTQATKVYYIQASPNLTTWTNYDGPIVGNGGVCKKLYPGRPHEKLFFRVEQAP